MLRALFHKVDHGDQGHYVRECQIIIWNIMSWAFKFLKSELVPQGSISLSYFQINLSFSWVRISDMWKHTCTMALN